jgi:TatD DNase family protein
MLIDTHCHLDFPDFALELDLLLERARAAGVARMITISTKVQRFPVVLALAESHPDVFCTVGTHPEYAIDESNITADQLVELARHPKCVGIGETGLDYHYDKVPRGIARRVFRTHIEAARTSRLPLIVHARHADDDIAEILRDEMKKGLFKGVLHCFTASRALATAVIDAGFLISFSGIVTFEKSAELREIAREIPLDQLVVETDAPFLAPVPFRGKRNEPAFVVATARVLAEIKGISNEDFAEKTTNNALLLFDKMLPPTDSRKYVA